MKTLELLKRLRDEYIHGELDSDINEAISELEQLKNRSCDNCIESSDGFTIGYYESKCKTCSMNYECKWESKE